MAFDWLEIFGFVTGLLGVWLNTRQNILTWPLAICNVVVYAVVFYKASLYSDVFLQIVYFILGIYGWWKWSRGVDETSTMPVTHASSRELLLGLGFAMVYTVAAGLYFYVYTDADMPIFDAVLTGASLSATWFMAHKRLQTWHMFVVIDLCYTVMYVFKSLYLTSILYLLFAVLAGYGIREWKKAM